MIFREPSEIDFIVTDFDPNISLRVAILDVDFENTPFDFKNTPFDSNSYRIWE